MSVSCSVLSRGLKAMAAERASRRHGFGGAELLFMAHFLLELVLGAVKLRGTYSGLQMPPGAEKFARHHGVSLLALAAVGGLVVLRGLARTETGEVVGLALALFHGGAVLVMLHALNVKVVLLHAPFVMGFAWHVLTVRKKLGRGRE